MTGFWYLATPYSRYPRGIDDAWRMACNIAAGLIKAGIRVYSPIAHTHPIAIIGNIDPLDHEIWLPADEPFMEAARGLIVYRAESWETSKGVAAEIEHFTKAGKPVVYLNRGVNSAELLEQLRSAA